MERLFRVRPGSQLGWIRVHPKAVHQYQSGSLGNHSLPQTLPPMAAHMSH